MGLIPTRGSSKLWIMEKKEIVDIVVCKNMRGVVRAINEMSLSKEDIVSIVRGDSEWYLLYQRNA